MASDDARPDVSAVAAERPTPRSRSGRSSGGAPRQLFWERFREDKAALFGAGVIAVLVRSRLRRAARASWVTAPERGLPGHMEDDFGVPQGAELATSGSAPTAPAATSSCA